MSTPLPYDFPFEEARYERAAILTTKIVRFIDKEFDKKCFEHEIGGCGDEPPVSGWSALVEGITDNGDCKNLYLMMTTDMEIGQAQYFPTETEDGSDLKVIALPFEALRVFGRTVLPARTISQLFHEVIHHLDYVDELEFDLDTPTGDLCDNTLFRRYVNTPHEQRAYFYQGVFDMRRSTMIKTAGGFENPRQRERIRKKHFPYFDPDTLSKGNLAFFESRFNSLGA